MTPPCSVYRVWSESGDLLYIGCSSSPLARAHQHCGYREWAREIASITVEWFASRDEALDAEAKAIFTEFPKWNVKYKLKPLRARGRLGDEYCWDDPKTWPSNNVTHKNSSENGDPVIEVRHAR